MKNTNGYKASSKFKNVFFEYDPEFQCLVFNETRVSMNRSELKELYQFLKDYFKGDK